jgi:protein JSN1
MSDDAEYDELSQTVAAVALGRSNSRNNGNGLLSPDEQGLEGPTSALWLGSIPTSTTVSTLQGYFEKYGPILSSRVLTHKNCGFVNFEKVESAVAAKLSLNGKEIFPGAGPIRINFAKPPSASNTPGHDGVFPSPSPDPFARTQAGSSGANGSVASGGDASTSGAAKVPPTVPQLHEMMEDILKISETFGVTKDGLAFIRASVGRAIAYTAFIDEIPPIREPTHARTFDAPKLRDIRKKIDQAQMTPPEIEQIAIEMLPEIVELSSDYLGNTVVQKLFERCSDEVRDEMLAQIAPHMAEIGCHKNGTWAAQKIIDQCKQPHQAALIAKHVHPYTVPLFLDQYGNYVLQGMLKYGSPHTDFLFETMLSKMWDLGKERYGARAMRACLESHHITKDQQAMLAAAIALHSVQLATNQNGGLLLTWFLDTCNLPQRRTVLAPQLVPHLVHLCTHKVAYLTVLKVINQKPESEARETILKALFFSKNDQVLEGILSDPKDGATFIFKAITTPFYDDPTRTKIVDKVRSVLVHIKADRGTGSYKRLMDEVGLSPRSGGGNGTHSRDHANGAHDRTRPSSRQAGAHVPHQQQHQQAYHQTAQQPQFQDAQAYTPQGQHAQLANQYGPGNGQFYGSPGPGLEFGYGIQRSDSVEPPVLPGQYSYPVPGNMYGVGNPALAPGTIQQLQYQLPRPAPISSYYPSMPANFNSYAGATPPIDQYRVPNPINGSPVPPQAMPGQHGQFGASGYNSMNGFPYPGGQNGLQNGTYLPDHGTNNRRGRVGHSAHPDKHQLL